MMTTEREERALSHLALEPWHEQQARSMAPICGWVLPTHYGNPEAEYRAARESVALFDASFLSVVRGAGKDHIDYLNRRLSQRVLELPLGTRIRANQLNAEGRMEADLDLYRTAENESLLLAPPAVTGDYLQFLAEKYVFSEDATFTDETGKHALFALLGPEAKAVVAQLGFPQPNELGITEPNADGLSLLTSSFLPGAIIVFAPSDHAAALWERLLALVTNAKGQPLGFLAFDSIRIEAGNAWWGIDLNARSIPLEADLTDAIHSNKGCYPGQETIARIVNLGHPPRKLVGIVWDSEDPPPVDTPLLIDNKEVGRLTSSTYSPRGNKAIGLSLIRWAHREPGTSLQTPDGLTGRTVALPFDDF